MRRHRLATWLPLLAAVAVCTGILVGNITLLPLVIAAFPWSLLLALPEQWVRGVGITAILVLGPFGQWWFVGMCIDAWRFRPRRGRCPNCDYDLRGSPGLRCPECGTTRRMFVQYVPATGKPGDDDHG